MQQAAPRTFGEKQGFALVEHWAEFGAMRANSRSGEDPVKRIAAGCTRRRQAGHQLAGAACTQEVVGRVFDRIRAMHTAARENQIGGGVEEAMHSLISSIQVALASAASGLQVSFCCWAPQCDDVERCPAVRPDSIRSERVDPAIACPFIEIPGIKPVATVAGHEGAYCCLRLFQEALTACAFGSRIVNKIPDPDLALVLEL